MSGNATYRYSDTAVLSVSVVDAPIVVTSEQIDEQLLEAYERVGLVPGMLEGLAGISERRWWPTDVSFADAASMAGAKALADAGVDPGVIGLLIDTSVCRDHLEPSAAVDVHHDRGDPPRRAGADLPRLRAGASAGGRPEHAAGRARGLLQ